MTPHAVFAGSMQLLAGVKFCTGHTITNHPHFEDKHFWERTLLVKIHSGLTFNSNEILIASLSPRPSYPKSEGGLVKRPWDVACCSLLGVVIATYIGVKKQLKCDDITIKCCSLIPSSPPNFLSLAVQKSEESLVMW